MFTVLEKCSSCLNDHSEAFEEGAFVYGPFKTVEDAQNHLRYLIERSVDRGGVEYQENRVSSRQFPTETNYSDFSICKLEPVCPETN
jgi:hypothetical protein